MSFSSFAADALERSFGPNKGLGQVVPGTPGWEQAAERDLQNVQGKKNLLQSLRPLVLPVAVIAGWMLYRRESRRRP